MYAIVLLAAIASIYQISVRSAAEAALRVWLPMLLLVSPLYSLAIPHMPSLSFTTCAILPIGFTLLASQMRNWTFSRADIWILLFVGGEFYSNLAATGFGDATYAVFGTICSGLFPYVIGKLILEQDGMRERFARRFTGLMFIVTVLSVAEFRMGFNVFTQIEGMFFPGQRSWLMQVRGGWVRVAGPYMTAELGGIVFLCAMMMGRWLTVVDKDQPEKRYLGMRRSVIVFLALAFGVFMSQSRGPELGAIFGLMIGQIGASKNVRRTAIVIGLFLAIGGTAGYFYAKKYTEGSIYDAKTIEQENAIYRRELLDNYQPIVDRGGFFGWGAVDFPKVAGQPSIDNEFLLLQITQGKLGFWMFVLLCAESALAIFRAAWRTTNQADLCFYTCLGGMLGGELLTLTTVYMGGQSHTLFFLAVGWSQALRATQPATAEVPQIAQGRFAFQKVFA
jgi:preprotein translocase subunit SecG